MEDCKIEKKKNWSETLHGTRWRGNRWFPKFRASSKSSVISTTMDTGSSMNNHYISRECFEPTSMPSIMWLEIGICAYLSKANYIERSSTSVRVYVRSMLLHYTLIEQRATFRRVDSGMACQSWGQWGGGPIKIIVRARKNERSVTISIVAPEREREREVFEE